MNLWINLPKNYYIVNFLIFTFLCYILMVKGKKIYEEKKMKKGINQWAFPSNLSLEKIFSLAKEYGFQGVELALNFNGELNWKSNKEELKKIRELAEKFGLEVPSIALGILWQYPLTSNDPKKVEMGKEIIREGLKIAKELSADTILVIPGIVNIPWDRNSEVIPYDLAYKRALSSIMELSKDAERYKVNIGLENVWNKFLLSPLEFKDFLDKVSSEYVGIYLDIGNILLTGYPEHWIKILGKYIKKVHVKDFKISVGTLAGFVLPLEGDVNWKNVMSALRDINYKNYLIAEFFPYNYQEETLLAHLSSSLSSVINI